MVILAGALWGTTGTVTKYILTFGIDPLVLALLRTGISFIVLFLFAILTGRRIRPKPGHMPFFLIFGAVSVGLFNIFYMIAIDLTTVTTAVTLLYTAPAFSMLMARVFLKEALTVKKILAVFLTFAGIILLVEAYQPGRLAFDVPGILAGLGSGFTYGIYSVFSKEAIRRGYSTLEAVIMPMGAGFLFLSLLRPPWLILPLLSEPLILWLLILVITVFSTILAYIFFVSGLRYVEAKRCRWFKLSV